MGRGVGVGVATVVVVTGWVAGGVARGTGVGVGVGLGTVTTLRGRESWVRPAETRSELTIEITAKTSAAINAILRLFKPLIKLPIHPPLCSLKVRLK